MTEGWKAKEIAEIMGTNKRRVLNAKRQHIKRIRRKSGVIVKAHAETCSMPKFMGKGPRQNGLRSLGLGIVLGMVVAAVGMLVAR